MEETKPGAPGTGSEPEPSEGFWERRGRTAPARRNLFWLLLGAIAAMLFFGTGGSGLFTPQ